MFPNIHEKDYRVLDLVRQREIRDSVAHSVSQKLHVTENLISRLGLEKELVGHTGCVNCLEWTESGQILASASDDMNIILWDPFRYEKKLVLRTRHHGNIFSVKFMPKSNDRILVSGAGDGKVRVRDLTLLEPLFSCNCHIGRVKRIATANSVPFLFWSAAEDGLVLQYDIRAPHSCKTNGCNNVLVNLVNHLGRYAEGKCISVNPKKPELIAVGANDAYIRMYDRRMIKLSQVPTSVHWTRSNVCICLAGEGDADENIPLGCAQYFIAGHLYSQPRDSSRILSTTYLTFSADGNELLVNMGGEQIYLFDINNPKNTKTCFGYSTNIHLDGTQDSGMRCVEEDDEDTIDFTQKNVMILPPYVEELKRQANEYFGQQKYTLAINLYNKAISYCPTAAVLFANRAAALMKRTWDGDIYAAFKDCQTTLLLDPGHVKAHFRLARCLFDLHRSAEADKVIRDFQQKFPEYAAKYACKALIIDIKEAMECGRDNDTSEMIPISGYEQQWRSNTIDHNMRFCGHCNTTTDIKEANFFGNNGQYIVAGSDDGSFFIWDRSTTNIIRVLRGDERIVNCLQPHPSTCLLATSGIDPVVRLWSPLPEDGSINDRELQDLEAVVSANQIRMSSDPFEVMLMNMGYRFPVQQDVYEDNDENDDQANIQPLNCRPS